MGKGVKVGSGEKFVLAPETRTFIIQPNGTPHSTRISSGNARHGNSAHLNLLEQRRIGGGSTPSTSIIMRRIVPPIFAMLGAVLVSAAAEPPVPPPLLDLRNPGKPPLLSTWAFAGGKAVLKIECPSKTGLVVRQFQVNGNIVAPIAGPPPPGPLKPGLNFLEIPMPATSKRGRVLCKIGTVSKSNPDGTLVANLMVDILPENAWASLAKHAGNGRVFIDPEYGKFRIWADEHGIRSRPVSSDPPIGYHFGKPPVLADAPAEPLFIVFERAASDTLPVIEVISGSNVTKIILPPGFLEQIPDSASAQALLLKHLGLLNQPKN